MQRCSQLVCDQAATGQRGDHPIGRDLSYPANALKPNTTHSYNQPIIPTPKSARQPFTLDREATPFTSQKVPVEQGYMCCQQGPFPSAVVCP